jgi:hypothetical protein
MSESAIDNEAFLLSRANTCRDKPATSLPARFLPKSTLSG